MKDYYDSTRQGESVVGRISTVSPRESERYCLQTLQLYVPGTSLLAYVGTVDSEVYPTYREDCFRSGLL